MNRPGAGERLTGLVLEILAHCAGSGLGARGCVHLSQDASNVAADRYRTNIKYNCDFLVGLSSSDLIEYGSLPGGEP